ncbi:MAG: hypothetical protein P4K98_00350 [Bryobacteraceae bacterium]|nr:hypothetical protein [Bryobacteraceae bacterium]
MRLLPVGLVIVALSLPVFGQTATPVKPNLPVLPPLPRPFSINPSPASAPELTAPGLELKFPHWRELLTKSESLVQYSAQPRPVNLKPDLIASAAAASGHCSIPLIEIPLPEHFDDGMVRKMGPHYDDRMLLPTPPVCPLHDERAESAKRK